MSIIIAIPSDDNGNLMKVLGSNELEFTVTSKPFFEILSIVYNQTVNTSSTAANTLRIAKTVIINGNTEMHTQLLQNGYSNYSVTSIPYFDIVTKLF
uniref:Uncharacterized protein n=1 Tax=Panagrolaimus superbus TaxID=310955 RepID=A0A914YYJ7_9BILA